MEVGVFYLLDYEFLVGVVEGFGCRGRRDFLLVYCVVALGCYCRLRVSLVVRRF